MKFEEGQEIYDFKYKEYFVYNEQKDGYAIQEESWRFVLAEETFDRFKAKVKEVIAKWKCISEDANPSASEVVYSIEKELGL